MNKFDRFLFVSVLQLVMLGIVAWFSHYSPNMWYTFFFALIAFICSDMIAGAILAKRSHETAFKTSKHFWFKLAIIGLKAFFMATGLLIASTNYIAGSGNLTLVYEGINWINWDLIMRYLITYGILYGITVIFTAILAFGAK